MIALITEPYYNLLTPTFQIPIDPQKNPPHISPCPLRTVLLH